MIAERIRKQLDRVDGVNVESLTPLVDEYRGEVAKVNARLEEAMGLLRRGLRSEAIQLANARPSVIEAAAQLDFVEVEEFVEICQFLSIAAPEKINRGAVEQLQQAMVEEQPLESLLREHRRLAMGKAPLAWRLRVLREISRQDPTNAVWLEDIEQWERARAKELTEEVRIALKQKNLAQARQLHEEINHTKWRIKLHDSITREVAEGYAGLLRASRIAELGTVVENLNLAFSEMNEEKGKTAREQWLKLKEELDHDVPQDLRELAEPALLWLDQGDEVAAAEKGHQHACSVLERKLQTDAKLVELQNAYHSVMEWNLGIDPILEQRYFSAVHRKETQAARKNRLILGALAATAMVMVATVGLLLWNREKVRERTAAVNALSEFLKNEKLEEAKAFVGRLRSDQAHLTSVTEIASLISQLEAQWVAEESRKATLLDLYAKVDLQEPSQIDLQLLRKAEEWAKTNEEKSKLLQIRRRREKYDADIQTSQMQSVRDRLREIDDRLDAFEKNIDLEMGESSLGQFQRELDSIKTEFPKAGPRAFDLIAISQKRVDSLRSNLRQLVIKKAEELRLVTNVRRSDSVQTLAQHLSNYSAAQFASPVAVEYAQAATEKELWNVLLGWNSFADGIQDTLADGILPTEVATILAKYEPMREVLGNHPATADSPNWREELDAISRRTELLESLISELGSAVMRDLKTVIGVGKPAIGGEPTAVCHFIHERFYQANKEIIINLGSKKLGLDAVADSSGAIRNFPVVGPLEVYDEPRSTLRQLNHQFVKDNNAFLLDWNVRMLQAIGTVYSNPKLDSRVKEILLKRLLETAIGGSKALEAELGGILDVLDSRGEEQKRWYEAVPFDSKLGASFDSKLRTVFSKAMSKLRGSKETIVRLGSRRYAMIGMLDRDAENKLFVRVHGTPPDVAFYIVASNPELPNAIRVIQAGKIMHREPKLELQEEEAIAGRPVFVMTGTD